jgi:hypothetical protein
MLKRRKHMGLNISTGGGEDFAPYVKYNAKAGRWYVKKDEGEVEVQNPVFVADFDNIKTGWFHFAAGIAPSIVYDPNLETPAPKPSENHKKGFELQVFSKATLGGVCVFSSTSGIVGSAINEIYEQYLKEKAANQGALPVVQCTGVSAEVGKHGTNYKPVLGIAKWIPRPAEFGGSSAQVAPQAAPVQQAPANSISEF